MEPEKQSKLTFVNARQSRPERRLKYACARLAGHPDDVARRVRDWTKPHFFQFLLNNKSCKGTTKFDYIEGLPYCSDCGTYGRGCGE